MPKILVIRACAIGDLVVNLPALRSFQQSSPESLFTFVGYPSGLELTREFVNVDRIHSIDAQPWSRLFYEPIAGLEFDSAIVWMKDPVVADNLLASGVPNVFRADPFPVFGHAADHLLRTLRLPHPGLPDLWKATSPAIVIHPGSGSPKKNWPHFPELLRWLPQAVLMPQDLSLVEVARYLTGVSGFIGNDSGITHLAAYLGCPTVALFGPTDPRIWGPLGRRSRIIWKSRLEDVSVDEVLSAIWKERPNPS